jgi:hypothetical protein
MAQYTVKTTKGDLQHGAAWNGIATFEYENQHDDTDTYTVFGDNAATIERMLDTDSTVISYERVN